MINKYIIPARSGTGIDVFVGGIAIVMFTLLFVFYGLPALRGETLTSAPEVPVQQVPVVQAGDVAIVENIDANEVNVNQPQK